MPEYVPMSLRGSGANFDSARGDVDETLSPNQMPEVLTAGPKKSDLLQGYNYVSGGLISTPSNLRITSAAYNALVESGLAGKEAIDLGDGYFIIESTVISRSGSVMTLDEYKKFITSSKEA